MLALLPLGFPPHHHDHGHARRTHEQPPAPPPPVASSVDELVLERTVRRNQEAHSTGYNRESDILTALKAEYTNGATAWRMPKTPKILSFGSSFGLEALAVAELYFPTSVVVGVDVDDATLEQARINTRNVSDRVFLFNADKLPLASLGSYDVVLAHNVLCHHPWPRHQTPDKWYPLSLFEETLLAISAVLRVGGLLSVVSKLSGERVVSDLGVGEGRLRAAARPPVKAAGEHFPPRDRHTGVLERLEPRVPRGPLPVLVVAPQARRRSD